MRFKNIFLGLILFLSSIGVIYSPFIPKITSAQDKCSTVLEISEGSSGSIDKEITVYNPVSGTCVSADSINENPYPGLTFSRTFQGSVARDSSGSSCGSGYAITGYDATNVRLDNVVELTVDVSGFGSTGGECEEFFGTITVKLIPETVTPTWELNCPLATTIIAGNTYTFNLSTTESVDASFTHSISPNVSNKPSINFERVSATATKAHVTTQTSTPVNTYTITFTATAGGVGKSCSVLLTVTSVLSNPVTARLTCTVNGNMSDVECTLPATGGSATLSWSSEYATSCLINNGVETNSTINGSATVSPASNTTYILSCTGPTGSATDTVGIIRQNQPPEPSNASGEIKCLSETRDLTTGNCTITSETGVSNAQLGWFTQNITDNTECKITQNNNPTEFSIIRNTISNGNTGSISGVNIYKLICGTIELDSATITVVKTPNPPSGVQVSASQDCGNVILTWSSSSGANGYRVYQSNYDYQQPSIRLWSNPQTVNSTQTTIATSSNDNTQLIFAVTAFNADGESRKAESNTITLQRCGVGSISSSDKDILSVTRGNTTIENKRISSNDSSNFNITEPSSPQPCNNNSDVLSSLVDFGLFREGDVINFKINICNEGNVPVTGLNVEDKMLNLELLNNEPIIIASLGRVASTSIAVFVPESGGTLEPIITPGTGESAAPCASRIGTGLPLKFNVNLPAKPTNALAGVCSIEIKAKVKYQSPANNPTQQAVSGSLYRFQNTAEIFNSLYQKTAITRPFLFQIGSGVPVRTEEAP